MTDQKRSQPDLTEIFSEANELRLMIAFEVALATVQKEMGLIPPDMADEIIRCGRLDMLPDGALAEERRTVAHHVMTVGSRVTFASPKSTPGPIVYATDFHDGAEESIAYAAFLSNQNRVPLHCIHVLPKAFVKTKNHIVAAVMDKALSDLQLRFGKDAVQPLCRTIFGKNVSKALVEYAREVHASAIVLAVTRRSAIASHLPLRRTSRILILANCPVFTLAHTKYVSP